MPRVRMLHEVRPRMGIEPLNFSIIGGGSGPAPNHCFSLLKLLEKLNLDMMGPVA